MSRSYAYICVVLFCVQDTPKYAWNFTHTHTSMPLFLSSASSKEEVVHREEEGRDLSPCPQEPERPFGCGWKCAAACPASCIKGPNAHKHCTQCWLAVCCSSDSATHWPWLCFPGWGWEEARGAKKLWGLLRRRLWLPTAPEGGIGRRRAGGSVTPLQYWQATGSPPSWLWWWWWKRWRWGGCGGRRAGDDCRRTREYALRFGLLGFWEDNNFFENCGQQFIYYFFKYIFSISCTYLLLILTGHLHPVAVVCLCLWVWRRSRTPKQSCSYLRWGNGWPHVTPRDPTQTKPRLTRVEQSYNRMAITKMKAAAVSQFRVCMLVLSAEIRQEYTG